MSVTLDAALAELDASIEREERGEQLAEEAARYQRSFRDYLYAAWPHLGYPPVPRSFHIDAIADHYQALVERDLTRLLVTIQPGAFKSTILSVLGPTWAWTVRPHERILGFSHDERLSTRDTTKSRTFMQGPWWQARFGHLFDFTPAENMKTQYSNTKGGHRIAGHVDGGTGQRGTLLQVDDPHDAKEARYSETQLPVAIEWWSTTGISRLDDTVENPGAILVVGQRVHENDLIGHLIETGGDRWVHLCLPTRYGTKHRYRYPRTVKLASGRKLAGDKRSRDGQLLMPQLQPEEKLAERVAEDGVTRHIFETQWQQDPQPRQGKILKRAGWRYYLPEWSFYAGLHDPRFDPDRVRQLTEEGKLPVFQRIVCTWDTSVKDRAHSDFVSGQVWGVVRDRPADRWLLRLWHERAGLNETIDAMLMLHEWASLMWAKVPVFSVIEKSANGPDAIAAIRAKVQGVIAYPEKGQALGSKEARAEAASPALDGGNCYLPGYANATNTDYDPRTPQAVQQFVEELSAFNDGQHDDQVDGWSCMVNYTRVPWHGKGRVQTPRGRKPRPAALPR